MGTTVYNERLNYKGLERVLGKDALGAEFNGDVDSMESSRTITLMSVVGARPNFMKIAPIVGAIARHNRNRSGDDATIRHLLVHTGQHYDEKMSDIFFKELGIAAPDISLGVGSGSHAEQTARVMMAFEPVCLREKPDWVVVVGDVNSTMACTLVASKLGIRVAHVEAGLRSFDRTMPEEINRLVTDALADLLLTPSPDADENLKREGIPLSKICLVGNTMIDTLVANLEQARRSPLPDRLGLHPKGFAYVTLHRPSNVDNQDNLGLIMNELTRLSRVLPVVFPVHPRTRKMFVQYGIPLDGKPNLKLLDPIGYHDSLCLTENAKFVLTDSGGLQEESTYLRTPCLTLRPNTERPVTIEIGSNRLTCPDKLAADIEDILQDRRPCGRIPELWDGRTAERVLNALLKTERFAV
jgi:UDP-N-acetylglucosamine 2-epimerase (non-hydrolysing)